MKEEKGKGKRGEDCERITKYILFDMRYEKEKNW
jgi:hypothetical protein